MSFVTFMRQIDGMEHTLKKAVKAAVPRLERSRAANERVGGKRRLRKTSDDERSGGEATQELCGMAKLESLLVGGLVSFVNFASGAASPKLEPDERGNTLRRDGKSLPRAKSLISLPLRR